MEVENHLFVKEHVLQVAIFHFHDYPVSVPSTDDLQRSWITGQHATPPTKSQIRPCRRSATSRSGRKPQQAGSTRGLNAQDNNKDVQRHFKHPSQQVSGLPSCRTPCSRGVRVPCARCAFMPSISLATSTDLVASTRATPGTRPNRRVDQDGGHQGGGARGSVGAGRCEKGGVGVLTQAIQNARKPLFRWSPTLATCGRFNGGLKSSLSLVTRFDPVNRYSDAINIWFLFNMDATRTGKEC